MVKSHVEESLGANPGDAALNPADPVAMGLHGERVIAADRRSAFVALRHDAYRLLFVAFCVNQTGFWISHISIQGLMVELSGNDPRWLGRLFFALFLPAFALAPAAGVAADRFDRKRIVLGCYASVAVVTSALAFLTSRDALSPPGLMAMALALGTCFAFAGPANMAIAANSVPAADLASAVSLQSALNNGTRVVGPMLAAPLVATHHFGAGFSIFAGAALVSAGLTARMQVAPHEPESDAGGILARLASGFQHARERDPALRALLTVAVLSLFGVSYSVLLPAYAQDVLDSRSWFAWLVAAAGFGAMLGALATGMRRREPGLASSALDVGIFGALLLAFAAVDRLELALALQVGLGFFYFSVMTSLQTLIQQIVGEAHRGRVMSLFQVCWAGLVPFGGLGLGTAASAFGVRRALAGGASVCLVFGIGMALDARGRVRARERAGLPRRRGG